MPAIRLAPDPPGDADALAARAPGRLLRLVRPVDALLVVVLFWGYDALCALRPGAAEAGMRHARWLGSGALSGVTAWERSLNAAVARSPDASWVCAHVYDLCHYAVTIAVILWLLAARPMVWPQLRRALWTITAVALVVFYWCPVAPLRFLPGFVDITARVDGSVADRADPTMYAAVPSLHLAWATWCACAVILATRGRWRWAAVGYPVVIAFVVVATANHALVDVLAGACLAVTAVVVCAGRRVRQPAGTVPRARPAGAPADG